MIVRIHKIHWPARWTTKKKDIDLEITDVDCIVKKVTHPCAKWAVGKNWYKVSNWFAKKQAKITLGEPIEIEEIKF